MRTGLTLDDIGDLLELPILAILATNRPNGMIMLSPVWHEWRDGGFNVWSGGASEGKIRHIQADPRITIVVAEQVLPYRGVEAVGRATLSKEGFHDVVRRTAARYFSPEMADGMAAGYPTANDVIRLVPDRLRIWDFADDAPDAGH